MNLYRNSFNILLLYCCYHNSNKDDDDDNNHEDNDDKDEDNDCTILSLLNHIVCAFIPGWPAFVERLGISWYMFHERWLPVTKTKPILIVHYEDMKRDLETELRRISQFLGFNFDK